MSTLGPVPRLTTLDVTWAKLSGQSSSLACALAAECPQGILHRFLVCRVTSLYSDGSCPLHQDACAKEEQAAGLQTCALMASQGKPSCLTQMLVVHARARRHSAVMSCDLCILAGVTSSVISSEAWRIMGEASDTVGASPDSTKFTKFTSRKVCLPGSYPEWRLH